MILAELMLMWLVLVGFCALATVVLTVIVRAVWDCIKPLPPRPHQGASK